MALPDIEAERDRLRAERDRLAIAVTEINAATAALESSADQELLRRHAARLAALTEELQKYHAAIEAFHQRLALLKD